MKKSAFILIMLAVALANPGFTQCTGGTNGGTITPGLAWSTAGTVGINGGSYREFTATAGNIYYFSFCTADGGNSTFDTQITINTATGTAVAGAYNDDFCGLQSYLAWTCTANGTYRVLASLFNCASNTNLGTLAYRYSPALSCPGNLGGGVTNVASLPYNSGAGSTCGSGNDLNASNMTTCGSTSYLGGEDRVWIFTPSANGAVTINLASTGTWNGLMLYQGCPLNGQGGSCVGTSQSSAGNQAITACVTAGITYYLVLDVFPSPNCNPYTNLSISAPATGGACPLGTGAVTVASLPYTSIGRTTCGNINDQTASNTIACGSGNYLTGEDEIFVFTPTSSGNISINISSPGSFTGMMLYRGCPSSVVCSGTAGVCIANEQSSTGSKSLCANVVAGQTYYLIIDSWASPACNPYNITISAPTAALAGSSCATAIPIPSLPYAALNESTACTGNDYTNASIGSCATLYESGEDKVYTYTSAGSECLSITISGASSNSIGYQVYLGCPGSAGSVCISGNGGANSGTLTGSVTLPSAGTYYIVVDSWAPPANVSYNINIVSFGSGAPNDNPCNSTSVALGIPFSSTNTCSGTGPGEPSSPGCWIAPNALNTVWFSVQVPASGQLRVRVIPGTLTNPQAALYSGASCSALALVACNDNATSCGSSINYGSELILNNLIPGATYYIAVDGYANLTGSFSLLAIDGTQTLPPLTNGQDCGTYLALCDTTMSFGDPGFQSFGNICDFTGGGANCLLNGERGSVWFDIPINSNGNITFSIIPKDWPGAPSTTGTDYDFAIWKTAGTGAVTCAQIATGAAPVSCNYSFLGLTGLFGAVNGTSPPQYPGFGPAFNAGIPVVTGERYTLVVSNFSNSTSGFDIVFGNASPISYGSSGTASVWSGGVDTDWYKKDNWGGCPIPDCSRDAIINGSIVLQPSVTGSATCKSLLINPGAQLTLQPGQSLSMCENFTNFGIFAAGAGSTVFFSNASANQNINGNLIGSNGFANLTISKTGGAVTSLQNTDVRGNFLINNATSVFNVSGKTHKVGGNFTNNGTYTPSGGTLEFSGSAAQTYFNPAQVNNVIINHSGPGVTLQSNLSIGNTGSLTLTNGRIVTTPTYEVSVLNRTPAAVSTGNANSFVQGYLQRHLNATGSYDFPVGEVSKGYQRANLNFAYAAAPTSIDNIRAQFIPYAVLPMPLGVSDCGVVFSVNALNNGRWNLVASNSPASGNFDLTLYNSGFTNAANAWTIMGNNGSGWLLGNGTCVVSPVNAVRRNGMNGIIDFGTAQGPSALDVEWIDFVARGGHSAISLEWVVSENDQNMGFELMRRPDHQTLFETLAWVNTEKNGQALNTYTYTDRDVQAGLRYYYRLRQLDLNGNESFSEIVSAQIGEKELENRLEVLENPTGQRSAFRLHLREASDIQLRIHSAQGALMWSEQLHFDQAGVFDLPASVRLEGLADGIYQVSLDTGKEILKEKILIFSR